MEFHQNDKKDTKYKNEDDELKRRREEDDEILKIINSSDTTGASSTSFADMAIERLFDHRSSDVAVKPRPKFKINAGPKFEADELSFVIDTFEAESKAKTALRRQKRRDKEEEMEMRLNKSISSPKLSPWKVVKRKFSKNKQPEFSMYQYKI